MRLNQRNHQELVASVRLIAFSSRQQRHPASLSTMDSGHQLLILILRTMMMTMTMESTQWRSFKRCPTSVPMDMSLPETSPTRFKKFVNATLIMPLSTLEFKRFLCIVGT
jgi:hypothetical protein